MPKTLTLFKQRLHDMYIIPAHAKETRAEVRRIIRSVESTIADLRYEDFESLPPLTVEK